MKKTILLIAHDASRTGAPILLINLATVLNRMDIEVDFLLKYGGTLEYKFQESGRKCFLAKRKASHKSILGRIKDRLSKPRNFDIANINFNEYQLIISNTVTNGDILPLIRKRFKGPILSYIHELEQATNFFTSTTNVNRLIESSDGFLVPALAVQKHLIKNLNIPEHLIYYLPYFIPSQIDKHAVTNTKREEFVVGAAGTIDWRKSPDLFISIAREVFSVDENVKIIFKWQGAIEGVELSRLRYDLEKLGLHNKIIFSNATDSIKGFYDHIDVFLLTSREDPYPLVILEAAAAKVPSICFKDAGGAPEFIENSSSGKAVPYLGIKEAALAILNYYRDFELLRSEGEKAFKTLSETHQSSDYISRHINSIFEKIKV